MAKPTREPRATKIVATIGPRAEREGELVRLLSAGVDVVRLNGAHCAPGDIARRVALVRDAEKVVGRPVGILLDLGGPKIRVGPIEGDTTVWKDGDLVEILPGQRRGAGKQISVTYPALLSEVEPGAEIRIADGLIRLKVEKPRERLAEGPGPRRRDREEGGRRQPPELGPLGPRRDGEGPPRPARGARGRDPVRRPLLREDRGAREDAPAPDRRGAPGAPSVDRLEDRADRGGARPPRDRRRVRRPDGGARGPRRRDRPRGRPRGAAGDPEGGAREVRSRHRGHADARVDDRAPGPDARRGVGRRRGGERRRGRRDALGRDGRRRLPRRGGPDDGRDRAGGRGAEADAGRASSPDLRRGRPHAGRLRHGRRRGAARGGAGDGRLHGLGPDGAPPLEGGSPGFRSWRSRAPRRSGAGSRSSGTSSRTASRRPRRSRR